MPGLAGGQRSALILQKQEMAIAEITASKADGVNVVAFLDMLAWSEGSDTWRQATKGRGYDVIVGGQLFTGYADQGYGDTSFSGRACTPRYTPTVSWAATEQAGQPRTTKKPEPLV